MDSDMEFGFAVGLAMGIFVGTLFLNLVCIVSMNQPNALVEDSNSFYEILEITEVEFREKQVERAKIKKGMR